MENKTFARSEAVSNIDQGLRQYMMRVYNFMSGGLCVTALVAYLIANTSLIRLFFNVNAVGQVMGMSALGWLALFAPFVMVFAFGWVLMKGTAAQVQGVILGICRNYGRLFGSDNPDVYRRQRHPYFPDYGRYVWRNEHLRLCDQA